MNDGAVNDGAVNDGAVNDGAVNDGAVNDGAVGARSAPADDVPRVSAATLLRACRRARTLSQRELAEIVGVARGTVDRIESGRGRPAYDTIVEVLAATGYALVAVDRWGRLLRTRDMVLGPQDRGGRRLPVHLRPVTTLPMMAESQPDHWPWWGWGSIAWSDADDIVPAWTFHKHRRELPRIGARGDHCDPTREVGRVWDDAT